MKKLIALLLCLVTVASLFAACGGGTELGGGKAGDGGNSAVGSLEDIPDDLVLTIGLPVDNRVEDYDTNAYTLWLEEQTGYDLQFVTMQSNATDYKAQLSSMLATGDELPDILWDMQIGSGAYEEYGRDGYFVDLTPYYNDKEVSKVFWERMDELKALDEEYYDYVIRSLTTEDGKMYAAARIEYSLIDTMVYQTYINQTWLDNLGLTMPTNPDELYDVLVAFRDKDPNQNGKKDEKPLICGTSIVGASATRWIINMFIYSNDNRWFNVDENNQLYLPQLTDKYREALQFMRKLKDEGLMFDTAFSMSNNDIKGVMNPPVGEKNTVGVVCGHPTLIFEPGKPSVYEYVAMPYWGNAVRGEQLFNVGTFITADCEYPRAAWELLMVMNSKEGAYRQRYGEKDVDYTDADPGTTSFIGLPAEIKVINEDALTGQNNSSWHKIQGTVLIQSENEVCQLTEDMGKWVNQKMKIMGDCYRNYVEAEENNNVDDKYIMPRVVEPEDVSDSHSNERSNVTSLLNEALAGFVTGKHAKYNNPNDDAQWAAYLAEVESLNYKLWMDHMQALYEDQYPERKP